MGHLLAVYVMIGICLLMGLDSLAYHRFRSFHWLDVVVVVLWPIALPAIVLWGFWRYLEEVR